MNKNNTFPYKKIIWKTLCHSKTSMDKLQWWYNKYSKEYWLFILSKDCSKIFILNALSGKYIKSLGTCGDKVGEFDGPVDMTIYDDYLIILEKDNHRVQIFSLPELVYVGFIGEIELSNPNCIESIKLKKDNKEFCCLYIGDNLDNKPSRRKCYFRFIFEINKMGIYDTEVLKIEPDNKGELGYIESIRYDSVHDNLLIVDKLSKDIKVFNFENNYKKTILKDQFKGEPGDIDLMKDNNKGMIFIGDFSRLDNFFHIYSRDLNYMMTLSSDIILKNQCFCIINHNHNKILYTADEDDCVLAYRIYEIKEIKKEKKYKNNKLIKNMDNIKEISAIGVLGVSVAAAAFYLKK
jgi:3-phytase